MLLVSARGRPQKSVSPRSVQVTRPSGRSTIRRLSLECSNQPGAGVANTRMSPPGVVVARCTSYRSVTTATVSPDPMSISRSDSRPEPFGSSPRTSTTPFTVPSSAAAEWCLVNMVVPSPSCWAVASAAGVRTMSYTSRGRSRSSMRVSTSVRPSGHWRVRVPVCRDRWTAPPSGSTMCFGVAAGSTSFITNVASRVAAESAISVPRHASATSAGAGAASVVPSGIATTAPDRVSATTAPMRGSTW